MKKLIILFFITGSCCSGFINTAVATKETKKDAETETPENLKAFMINFNDNFQKQFIAADDDSKAMLVEGYLFVIPSYMKMLDKGLNDKDSDIYYDDNVYIEMLQLLTKKVILHRMYAYIYPYLQELRNISPEKKESYKTPEDLMMAHPTEEIKKIVEQYKSYLDKINLGSVYMEKIKFIFNKIKKLDNDYKNAVIKDYEDDDYDVKITIIAQILAARAILIHSLYSYLYFKIQQAKDIDNSVKELLRKPEEIQNTFQGNNKLFIIE